MPDDLTTRPVSMMREVALFLFPILLLLLLLGVGAVPCGARSVSVVRTSDSGDRWKELEEVPLVHGGPTQGVVFAINATERRVFALSLSLCVCVCLSPRPVARVCVRMRRPLL